MPKHGSLLEKLHSFGHTDYFSCFFAKWGTFCIFLLKSSFKCKNMVVFSKSCMALAKSMIFRPISQNEALFATFFWNIYRKAKTWELAPKVAKFWPNRWSVVIFHFFTKWATFWHFLLKSWQKRRNMVVSSKSCKFRPNQWFSVIFHEMSHFFHLFAEKLTKTLKHSSFIEKCQAFSKSMIFRAFWRNKPFFATFCWKVNQNAETC